MRHDEDRIQAAIVAWARLVAPSAVIFAVPNGGRRDPREAARLRMTGTLAGVPDVVVVHEGRALFIEVKTASGRLSAVQVDMIARLRSSGADVAVVRSVDECRSAFANWGIVTRESVPAYAIGANP